MPQIWYGLIRSNHPDDQLNQITKLADEIWQGAGDEIKEFIDCALSERAISCLHPVFEKQSADLHLTVEEK